MTPQEIATKRLALEGGRPVRETPLPTALGGAMIGDQEKQAVLEVLDSQSLFRYYGPKPLHKVATLEQEFARFVGQPRALAVSSGTAALRTALVALGLPRGGEILMPAYSFLACPAAVLTLGLVPVFVECDDALLMDPGDLAEKISTRSRGILVVHTDGAAADLTAIIEIARRRRLPVIEDCAQACAATWRGRPVGSFGDVATFSLQALKVITSGEGGVLVTSEAEIYERAVYYHDLGFQRPGRTGSPIVGENLRMSELTAAVALAQLRKLPGFVRRMREHHRRLTADLGGVPGIRIRRGPDPDGDQGSALVLQCADEVRARYFRKALRAENIPCDGCFAKLCYGYPVILDSMTRAQRRRGLCTRTESILKRSVSIIISPALNENDVRDIASAVRKVAQHMGS
jgi:8-amino-3,8-dideoxy-alpha-D-manno-octulosonate transaminase